MIASTITIGFGGSVGTEATIVLTGASIGSNMARFFHMNYKVMTLMIGCGAAGAIAGIFKAPIAGIVFTLEVLMLDLTMASLVPLMIAAISSYVIVYFLMGEGVVLEFAVHEHFALANVPYYIILGIGFCIFYPDEYPNREIYYRDKEPIQKNFGRRSIIGLADLYFSASLR